METRTLVLDSSVVVKWFLTEEGSEKAIDLFDEFAAGRIKIAAPTILHYEVGNALKRSPSFDEKSLRSAGRALSGYAFEIWHAQGLLLEEAMSLSHRKDITVYDASFVALALRKNVSLCTEDAELLTKFPEITVSLAKVELQK